MIKGLEYFELCCKEKKICSVKNHILFPKGGIIYFDPDTLSTVLAQNQNLFSRLIQFIKQQLISNQRWQIKMTQESISLVPNFLISLAEKNIFEKSFFFFFKLFFIFYFYFLFFLFFSLLTKFFTKHKKQI